MDSKEQMILHWMDIAAAVFRAEDEISKEWFPKLRKAKDMDSDWRRKLADEYLRAIATEIIENSGFTFEEDTERDVLERGADIIRSVFGIDVRNRSRERSVADIRSVFCYVMRKDGQSLSDIGRFMGIDHSTVYHSVRKVSDALEVPVSYPELIEKYNRFMEAWKKGE